MKFLKAHMSSVIVCLFEIAVGILLLVNPVGFTSGIIIIAGIILMAGGLISIISYFRSDAVEAATGQMLGTGLVALLIGAFCTFDSGWFIATFPVLTLFYGIVILIIGLYKVQWTVDILRLKKGKWQLQAVSALLTIVFGSVIVGNPFTSTTVLWVFTGITLIVASVSDVAALFFGTRSPGPGTAADNTEA